MKRPLYIASIFYVLGIIIGIYINISIALYILINFVIAIIILIITKQKGIIIYLFILILGFIQITNLKQNYEELYNKIEKRQTVKAEIISEPVEKEYKVVYKIKIIEVENEKNKQMINTKWILNVKKTKNGKYEIGNILTLVADFNKPEISRNYKGFDDSLYLKSKGLCGRADAVYMEKQINLNSKNWVQNICHNIRVDINKKFCKYLSKKSSGIALDMLIGDNSIIADDIKEYFRKAGLIHILAISGMHISYVIIGISLIFGKAKNKIIKIITIILIIFFIKLTGKTPSVMRACIMACMAIIGNLLYRKTDIYNSLGISAFIILLINPYYVIDIGFQLSFIATIGIIFIHPKMSSKLKAILKIKDFDKKDKYLFKKTRTVKEKIKAFFCKILIYVIENFSVSISANTLILPILVINYNNISLTFWISNILVGPFVGAIIFLGYICYFTSFISIYLSKIFFIILENLINILIQMTKLSSELPLSSIITVRPYWIEVIIYYISILFCIYSVKLKKSTKLILVALMIIALLVNYIFYYITNKDLQIYFVDVGQGDCTLICTPQGRNILIDGGGSENSSYDVGKNILFPYLLSRRIKKLDYIIISHFDSDHVRTGLYIFYNN